MESLLLENITLTEEGSQNDLPINPNNTEIQSDQILSQSLDSISETTHTRNCGCAICKNNPGEELQSNSTNNETTEIEDTANSQLVEPPLVPGLISDDFSGITQLALEAIGGETLNYYIHQGLGSTTFQDGASGESRGHTAEESAFIQSVFESIDPLIDLDFILSETSSGTTFDIYSLDSYDEWLNTDIVGQVNPFVNANQAYWDIYWLNTNQNTDNLNGFDANTIIHEIGHALGLSHPFEDPSNINWTTDDTVMSYNISPDGWDFVFSEADIDALQLIWGIEDDDLTPTTPTPSQVPSPTPTPASTPSPAPSPISSPTPRPLPSPSPSLSPTPAPENNRGDDGFTQLSDADESFTGQANFRLRMMGGNDFLEVTGGSNYANGNMGEDTIIVLGGFGEYLGGKDNDTIEVLGAQEGTSVNGNLGEDFITGTVTGVSYRGGKDNDFLEVSQGDVWGDNGADTFRALAGDGYAVIQDYTIGEDLVDIDMDGSWSNIGDGLLFTNDSGDQLMLLLGVSDVEQVTIV